jgi:hypothetical protein
VKELWIPVDAQGLPVRIGDAPAYTTRLQCANAIDFARRIGVRVPGVKPVRYFHPSSEGV